MNPFISQTAQTESTRTFQGLFYKAHIQSEHYKLENLRNYCVRILSKTYLPAPQHFTYKID